MQKPHSKFMGPEFKVVFYDDPEKPVVVFKDGKPHAWNDLKQEGFSHHQWKFLRGLSDLVDRWFVNVGSTGKVLVEMTPSPPPQSCKAQAPQSCKAQAPQSVYPEIAEGLARLQAGLTVTHSHYTTPTQ